jgi:hypothetical protein|tara:strand:+ start:974 stop:1120 length:147 start_codon:yes stop_codon:yes gene_type:complete
MIVVRVCGMVMVGFLYADERCVSSALNDDLMGVTVDAEKFAVKCEWTL